MNRAHHIARLRDIERELSEVLGCTVVSLDGGDHEALEVHTERGVYRLVATSTRVDGAFFQLARPPAQRDKTVPVEFTVMDRYSRAGRGGEALLGPCPVDTLKSGDLCGQRLLIDGVTWEVASVEWWAIDRGPRQGELVGVQVRPVQQGEQP